MDDPSVIIAEHLATRKKPITNWLDIQPTGIILATIVMAMANPPNPLLTMSLVAPLLIPATHFLLLKVLSLASWLSSITN